MEKTNREDDNQPLRSRGKRTRYSRRNWWVIIGITAGALALIGALVAAILISASNATKRATLVTPRNLDVWSVYSDGRVRFATLFYVDDEAAGLPAGEAETVTVAGPLAVDADSILAQSVIGGTEISREALPGPGRDVNYIYELFTLERVRDGKAYGIDSITSNSPYLSRDTGGVMRLALGAGDTSGQMQIIVAIAIPGGSKDITVDSQPSYRDVRIGGWHVYYFDTTNMPAERTLSIRFMPGGSPPDLDIFAVDRQR